MQLAFHHSHVPWISWKKQVSQGIHEEIMFLISEDKTVWLVTEQTIGKLFLLALWWFHLETFYKIEVFQRVWNYVSSWSDNWFMSFFFFLSSLLSYKKMENRKKFVADVLSLYMRTKCNLIAWRARLGLALTSKRHMHMGICKLFNRIEGTIIVVSTQLSPWCGSWNHHESRLVECEVLFIFSLCHDYNMRKENKNILSLSLFCFFRLLKEMKRLKH